MENVSYLLWENQMNTYHKIQNIFKRNEKTHKLINGEYSSVEFEYLKNNKWDFTEKVDGTNIRILFDGEKIYYKGKTDKAQTPPVLLEALHSIFESKVDIFKKLFTFDPHQVLASMVCLYGEGYGPKINKGGKYRDDHSFVLFDIKIGNWWLKQIDVWKIADALSIKSVPVVGQGTLIDAVSMCRKGFKSQWGDFPAEGIVARPQVELKSRNGNRIIVKLKLKDFDNE